MKSAPIVLTTVLTLALPAASQQPTSQDPKTPIGNDIFMEAVVDEKPAVLSAPQLVFPDLLRQAGIQGDRKSTRLNSSHGYISYAVFCLKKKKLKAQTCAQFTPNPRAMNR